MILLSVDDGPHRNSKSPISNIMYCTCTYLTSCVRRSSARTIRTLNLNSLRLPNDAYRQQVELMLFALLTVA